MGERWLEIERERHEARDGVTERERYRAREGETERKVEGAWSERRSEREI